MTCGNCRYDHYILVHLCAEGVHTLLLVETAIFISLLFGLPLRIFVEKSNRLDANLRPLLDIMQTIFSFVYLISAIIFFGIGNVSGIMMTVADRL